MFTTRTESSKNPLGDPDESELPTTEKKKALLKSQALTRAAERYLEAARLYGTFLKESGLVLDRSASRGATLCDQQRRVPSFPLNRLVQSLLSIVHHMHVMTQMFWKANRYKKSPAWMTTTDASFLIGHRPELIELVPDYYAGPVSALAPGLRRTCRSVMRQLQAADHPTTKADALVVPHQFIPALAWVHELHNLVAILDAGRSLEKQLIKQKRVLEGALAHSRNGNTQ